MQVASEQKAVLCAAPHFGILVGQEMHHPIRLGLVAVMRGQQHLAKLIDENTNASGMANTDVRLVEGRKKAATTIVATAAADGWLQVPCQPFAAPAAPDLPLALCRRLQRRGWAVVHRPSGQVVAHGSTRARAALAAAVTCDSPDIAR